jgi:spore maturation protein CgeB
MDALMRILFAHWATPILMDRIMLSLRRLGHTVESCLVHEVSAGPGTYDIVFFYHPWHGDIPSPTARRAGRVSVVWAVEDPYEIDIIELAGREADMVWDTDRRSADYLRMALGKPVLHVPHCYYDPLPHASLPVIKSQVCFLGNAFPLRVELIKTVESDLKHYDVMLVGSGWSHAITGVRISDMFSPQASVASWLGADICLNIHRQNDVDHANRNRIVPSSPNNRLFDVAGLGKCQLVDSSRLPELLEYFTTDEIALFDGPDQLMSAIHNLLANPQLRYTLAKRAKERVASSHTPEIRFAQAFKATQEVLGCQLNL